MVDLGPQARGLWRFSAMARYPSNVAQGELSDARSRQMTFDLRAPNTCSLTMPGKSGQLGWLSELRSDIVCYRYSSQRQAFVPMLRACVTQSQDQLSPTVHTTTINAKDYRAVLSRFVTRDPLTYSQQDQGHIAQDLIAHGNQPRGFPGSLGVSSIVVDPYGNQLANNNTGVLRDRSYNRGQVISEAVDNMATDINGYEWSVEPSLTQAGVAYIWYPQRGSARTWIAQYGSTVSNVSRSVSTDVYESYSMVTGAQDVNNVAMYAESFGAAWNDPVTNPEGAWMTATAQPDVSIQATLQQSADGNIALYGDLEPTYSLQLVPGRWSPDDAWLGDTVKLLISSGRLSVNTAVRITQVQINVDESGVEAVTLTAGLPSATVGQLFDSVDRRLNKLETR